MKLRGIDIATNKMVGCDLSQYSIRFDQSRVQIHSVVFSHDHVQKCEQPREQTQQEFLDALVLGVVHSDTDDLEIDALALGGVHSDADDLQTSKIKVKPISAKVLRDTPTFKFDECSRENTDHVIIQKIKEKAASRQEYFQNNIKIQVCSHF